jgi:Ca2+-binding EF-hand superfamily protein
MSFESVELKKLFDLYDVNEDGYISKAEFIEFTKDILQREGIGVSNSIFEKVDLNSDSRISYDEFIAFISND